jgi:pimeloyl-ACP methyl ester carboxylesterase
VADVRTAPTVLGDVPQVESSAGAVEYLLTGEGSPTTVFVHGLAMSIPDTRVFGGGVAGTKVFLHLRGHGHSATPARDDGAAWTYDALADDVTAVSDAVGATRALGVSLGAAALLRLLIRDASSRRAPRFDRVVLVLPACLDEPISADGDTAALADAVETHDAVAAVAALLAMQPAAVRSRLDVRVWARRHADWLMGSGITSALRALPVQVPVPDLDALGTIRIPVLVLAQVEDAHHPLAVAQQLVAALPDARLEVSDGSWLWTPAERSRLRSVVSAFLDVG